MLFQELLGKFSVEKEETTATFDGQPLTLEWIVTEVKSHQEEFGDS